MTRLETASPICPGQSAFGRGGGVNNVRGIEHIPIMVILWVTFLSLLLFHDIQQHVVHNLEDKTLHFLTFLGHFLKKKNHLHNHLKIDMSLEEPYL